MKKEIEYAILYECGKRRSYFHGFAGSGMLPMFGATYREASRYPTKDLAEYVLRKMPFTANVCCKVVPLKKRTP